MWGDSRFSRAMQRDVHRTRPTNIRAPALVWHSAFFLPNGVKPSDKKGEMVSNESIYASQSGSQERRPDHHKDKLFAKAELDRFLLSLYRAFVEGNLKAENFDFYPIHEGQLFLFNSRYLIDEDGKLTSEDRVLKKDALDRDCDFVHGDYGTIRIKFLIDGENYEFRCDMYREYFCFIIYANDLGSSKRCGTDLARLRDLALSGGSNGETRNRAEKRHLAKALYKTYWEGFADIIKKRCPDIEKMQSSIIFGNVFADFRGLVLPIWKERSDQTLPEEAQHDAWGANIAENMLDFITDKDKYECTASYMLDDKVLYISDLGQVRLGTINERIPVTYLACLKGVDHGKSADPGAGPPSEPKSAQNDSPDGPASGEQPRDAEASPPPATRPVPRQVSRHFVNKWQLGRLIDRLHSLGSVRLAALRDFDLIVSASRAVADFDPIIRDAQDRTDRESINAARDYFYAISGKFLDCDTTKRGLQFRIERSRYYANRFARNKKFLRIRRLEGYQSYHQFVERRIGPNFELIDRLGARYERAGAALSLREKKHADLQSQKSEELVMGIQEWADFALIGFLLPYYSFSLLTHIIPNAEDDLGGVALMAWIVAFTLSAFRFYGLQRSISARRFGLFIGTVLAFLACLGIVLYSTDNLKQFFAAPYARFMSARQEAGPKPSGVEHSRPVAPPSAPPDAGADPPAVPAPR